MCIRDSCNIRDFQSMLDPLGSSVLEFVNLVASIIHKNVYNHLGYGNKNLGSTFLLVWRFHSDELTSLSTQYRSKMSNKMTRRDTYQSLVSDILPKMDVKKVSVQNKCDIALIGLVKAMIDIELVFKNDNFFYNEFGVNRFEMGFGMHCGWAVEGAIGSYMKMDTRYYLFLYIKLLYKII